jgi:hypothetical protein
VTGERKSGAGKKTAGRRGNVVDGRDWGEGAERWREVKKRDGALRVKK